MPECGKSCSFNPVVVATWLVDYAESETNLDRASSDGVNLIQDKGDPSVVKLIQN